MRTFPASGRGQPCAQRRRAPAGFRGAGSPAAAAPEADCGAGEQDQKGKAVQPAGGAECRVKEVEESNQDVIRGVYKYMEKLDNAFLIYACNILADTNSGISGMKIVKYCNSYAIDYNRKIPFDSYPFDAPNKRTALKENIQVFDAPEQFRIIKELCELPALCELEKVKELRAKLYTRYGNFATEKISETELVQKTKHWLSGHPLALKQYESALTKYEGGIFERNTLDDMRLALELLVKDLLSNNKSLENQISEIGTFLKSSGASVELRNMVTQVIKYYTDFQNNHVKHNDAINDKEIEYIIELTSVVMKYLIRVSGGKI